MTNLERDKRQLIEKIEGNININTEMLEALKKAVEWFDRLEFHPVIAQMKEAIRKAEGR